jgi:hypothetical protein
MSIRDAATMASTAFCSTVTSKVAAVSSMARASAWMILATTSESGSVALMSPLTGAP